MAIRACAEGAYDGLSPVTPGTTYYLQPVVQSGDNNWSIIVGNFDYANGTWIAYRVLWFREGTIVPEPSSALLLALAAATVCAPRFRRRRNSLGCR